MLVMVCAVALLVEALRYKPEGRGFDRDFSSTYSFRPHIGPGVDSASNKNEYKRYFMGGGGGGGGGGGFIFS